MTIEVYNYYKKIYTYTNNNGYTYTKTTDYTYDNLYRVASYYVYISAQDIEFFSYLVHDIKYYDVFERVLSQYTTYYSYNVASEFNITDI